MTVSAEQLEALKQEQLLLSLGDFCARLQTRNRAVIEHINDVYRDYTFQPYEGALYDQYLSVRAPNILRGLIKRQIIPDPGFAFPAVPLPEAMGALAFEMGLNISVALKVFHRLILHAGVVANESGSIIISAASGGGKSTLTALLMEAGFQLLSDEFGIVDMASHHLLPYPRPVSLKNKSIDIVRDIAGHEWISPIIRNSPKGDVAYRRARPSDIDQADRSSKPKLIIFPNFEADSQASINKVESADAMMRLITSSTNYQMIGEQAFVSLNAIVKTAHAVEMTYGSSEDALRLFKSAREEAGL
jgi:HprK-related kinase A